MTAIVNFFDSYCQRKSPKGAFKHSRPKNHGRSKKRKYLQWSAKIWKKTDTPPQTLLRKHYRSIRTTFSKNTFGELLPVFFKQFNLKYDASFWSSKSFFVIEFLKTVALSCIFSESVGMFIHKVESLIEILYLDLLSLNGGIL